MTIKAQRSRVLATVASIDRHAARQRGAVLITSLIFLIIITLIGITAMQNAVLEERMAGNMHDRNLAFQSAEAALRDAEEFLAQRTRDDPMEMVDFNNAHGLYRLANSGNFHWEVDATWSGSASRVYGDTLDHVAEQPRYIIEPIQLLPLDASAPPPAPYLFRITARGVGGSETAVVLLQSTFNVGQ